VLADGTTLPVTGQAPHEVCTASGQQGILQAASDGAGGAYVSWVDQRSDQGDIYLTRLTASKFTLNVPGLPAAPKVMSLGKARPSPSWDHVEIGLALSRGDRVSATIVDVAGRRLRQLKHGYQEAGTHVLSWNGLDDFGRRSAPGLYWLVVRTSVATKTARLLRLQ
jgi:hypothetical protein